MTPVEDLPPPEDTIPELSVCTQTSAILVVVRVVCNSGYVL